MVNDRHNSEHTKEYPEIQKALREEEQPRTGSPRTTVAAEGKGAKQKAKDRKGSGKSGSASSSSGNKSGRKMPVWLRIVLKILRLLLVPVLCAVALYAGLRIGYVTFGDQSPDDIWDMETWKHMYDLIFSDS